MAVTPSNKVNRNPVPPGASTTGYVQASDINPIVDALTGATGGTLPPLALTSTVGTAARTLADRFSDVVNAKDFLPVGWVSGVTDSTLALQAAALAVQYGGILLIPAGKYRLTDEITIRAGVTVMGEGSADFTDGAPPSITSPTYLYQETAGKSVFFIGGGAHMARIENLSMAPALVPSHTPAIDGKYGIRMEGSYPLFVWGVTFSRLTFYNFERGISIHDPHAGTLAPPYTYDWAVNPIGIDDCRFQYPAIGLYINTNNADALHVSRSMFFVPQNGNAVYLRRFGFSRFDTVFGGSGSPNSVGVYIEAAGTNPVDKLAFVSCQWESFTNSLLVAAGGTYYPTNPLVIEVDNGIAELGSDVTLSNAVHFISRNSRWSVALYVNSANVKVSSYDDHFDSGGRWYVLVGDERDVWQNVRLGPASAALPGLFASSEFDSGRMTQHATAAPVGGKFYVGDRVINSVPTVGQPKAWVCTVAGTPGTWVSEGNL